MLSNISDHEEETLTCQNLDEAHSDFTPLCANLLSISVFLTLLHQLLLHSEVLVIPVAVISGITAGDC